MRPIRDSPFDMKFFTIELSGSQPYITVTCTRLFYSLENRSMPNLEMSALSERSGDKISSETILPVPGASVMPYKSFV